MYKGNRCNHEENSCGAAVGVDDAVQTAYFFNTLSAVMMIN